MTKSFFIIILLWIAYIPLSYGQTPTFAPPVFYTSPVAFTSPNAIVSADFTGDGKPDIAVGLAGGLTQSIAVYANSGTGTFSPRSTTITGNSVYLPWDMVAGDFDGDGDQDIAALSISGLLILTNNGTGASFSLTVDPGAPGAFRATLTTGFFNADNKADIAVTNPDQPIGQKLKVMISTSTPGAISFSRTNYPGNLAAGVVAADFNNDGHADIFTANPSSNALCILLGDGTGSFGPAVNYFGSGGGGATVADYNNDGFKDVLTATGSGSQLFLNDGSGGLLSPTPLTTIPAGTKLLSDVITADVNGDNNADIIYMNTVQFLVYPGNGNGTFGPLATFNTGIDIEEPANTVRMTARDFNGDGKVDLAASVQASMTGRFLVLRNTTVSAPEPTTPATGLNFSNITATIARAQWTSGNGAGRIVVARAGAPVSQGPADLATYTANASYPLGQEIGAGTGNRVVYAGTGNLANIGGLDPLTTYYFAVYEYNGSGSAINYRQAGAPTGSLNTIAAEPTTSAKGANYTNLTDNSIRIQWTPGNGTARVVVMREGGPVSQTPVDFTTYTANSSYPLGQEIGTGNRVIYDGTGNAVDVTGLSGNTIYYIAVYEYNGSGALTNYRTVSAGIVNFRTAPAEPETAASNIIITSVQPNAVLVQWTAGSGARRILVASAGEPINYPPVDFTTYTANASYPLGQETVPGTGNRVLNSTSVGTGIKITGLEPGVTYYFSVYEYNGAGTTTNYKIADAPIASVTTSSGIMVIDPADGVATTNVALKLNGMFGATSYTTEVNTNDTFTGNSVVRTGASLTPSFPEIRFNMTYYVRVKSNITDWGPATSFTTGGPETFAYVTSPVDGATVTSNTLTFNVVPSATRYTSEVSTSSSFPAGSTLTQTGTRAHTYLELTFNTLYYVRVKTNAGGTWGPVSTFTTATRENYNFITSPAEGSTTVQYNLIANSIPGATTYTIELNTSPTFEAATAIEKTSATTTIAFPEMLYGLQYYARVKTDLSTNWSPTRAFKTGTVNLFTYLISPTNASTNVPIDVTLVPNNINGTSTYTIVVSPNADFSTPFFEQTGTGTPYAPTLSGLSYSTQYYVRISTDLSATWGPTRWFTTVSAPGLQSLASDNTAQAYPNTFTNQISFSINANENHNVYTTILDGQGQPVYESSNYTTNVTNSIEGLERLTPGIYYLRVVVDKKETKSFRMVKN